MGTWTIYSVGDAAFLEQILISVAMVTGTNDFPRAAGIGLLIALIVIGVQSMMRGSREFNIQQIFTSWIVFSLFFVPTTTVLIEDNVSGSVRVVDNVPFGVGAAGGIISTIGYRTTQLFEQGYGYIAPYITETYFADSLNLLNKLRSATADPKLMVAMSQDQGGDLRRSWDNYIRECTLTKIDLGEDTVDGVMSSKLPDALLFNSDLFGTQIAVNSTGAQNVTCREGYHLLDNASRSALNSAYFDLALNQSLGLANPENPPTQSAFGALTDALQALRFTQNSAQDYVYASILSPVYEQAVLGKYQDMQDFSSAVMVNQAIQQRNTQWAAEQSMFMSVVRPMQTFFEGFVYAITPLLAILIIMGSFGMSLAFKYLQTLFWIQLWLPILSIVNLYISTSAAGEMSSYDIVGEGVSMYALAGTSDVLQTWIATGGMLAAAVPIISLFVVTGSAYAMTSIASRIGGQDHINERIATPDVVQPSPYMQQQTSYTNNPHTGTIATGAEELITTTSIGSTIAEGMKSAQDRQNAANQSFGQELGRTLSSSALSQQSGRVMQSLGSSLVSAGTQQTSMVNKIADQYAAENNWSREQRQQFIGALSAQLATGGKLGLGASGTAQDVNSVTQQATEAYKNMHELGWTDQDTQQLTTQMAQGLTSESGQSWLHGLGDDATKSLKESANELVSASSSYSQFEEMRSNLGSNADMSLRTVAGVMAAQATPSAKQALTQLNEFYNSGLAGKEMQEAALRRENLLTYYGMPQKEAQIVSRLEAMSNPANSDKGSFAPQAAAGIVGTAVSLTTPSEIDPGRNSNLAGPTFVPGQVRSDSQNAVAPARALSGGDHWNTAGQAYTPASLRFEEAQHGSDVKISEDTVRAHHAGAAEQLDQQAMNTMNAAREQMLSTVVGRLTRGDMTKDMSEWTKFMGVNSNYASYFNDVIGTVANKVWSGDFNTPIEQGVQVRQEQRLSDLSARLQSEAGLTAAQATYFATLQTGAGGIYGNNERAQAAYEQVVAENPEMGEHIAARIRDSVEGGATHGPSYLADVAMYNNLKDPITERK